MKRSATKKLVKAKTTITPSPTKKREVKAKDKEDEEVKIVHKGTVSNGVMVDRFVPNADKKEVYSVNGITYACNLSYTDCKNNNNKYYIM